MSHSVEIVVPEDADVEQAGETVTVEVDEGQSILQAARASGLWLPADCQQGWCTSCAARLVEGDVDQSPAKRYYEEDDEADMILTCTAFPESDCRIRGFKKEEMLDHRAEHDLPPGSSKR